MSRLVTYVYVEAPTFIIESPPALTFYIFGTQESHQEYLDPWISATTIASIKSVEISPAIVSLGQDMGQRATITVTFRDHKHIFNGEDFDSGTFWGKWRARYGTKLRGKRLLLQRTTVEESIFETRTFVIESTDGPTTNGEYKIIAKDILKLADGDRAQAPVLSNGFLATDITDVATTLTLSPSGIGDEEYPAQNSPDNGFYVAVGGKEIIHVYRNSDTLHVIARAQFNTEAVAHTAQDRVQLVLVYTAVAPQNIIYELLVTYAGISASYITFDNWHTEITTYLNTVYTAVIAEPTSVNQLVSELIEQAGLVLWWDDVNLQIRLQVLRSIATTADTFNADNIMENSLDVKEQPEKRLSQVYTYFGKINPLVKEDQVNNYRSTAFAIDEEAEADYGSAAIKKIFSRWIPDGGRPVADTLNEILLARFVTPPRRISFDIMRGSTNAPTLGVGYQIGGWPFQNETGAAVTVPVQITRLNPKADIFEIEAEEMNFEAITPTSPDAHDVIIDGNIFNVNLRTMHDSIYSAAESGTTVTCTILDGITVGSTSTATPAFVVGVFPAGVIVNVVVLGRIQGKGGIGGNGAHAGFISPVPQGQPGSSGGTALYTRQAINLSGTGAIWGGGGGGGGSGAFSDLSEFAVGGNGGGGGAGSEVGLGGSGGGGVTGNGGTGNPGTATAGGTGGVGGAVNAGTGGGPGLAGSNGGASTSSGGGGGTAGTAIDGSTLGPITGTVSDVQGAQIN